MGFWVASADASGNRLGLSEEQLLVAPADVEYPMEPAARVAETSGGTIIQQFPAKDPRRRVWVWRDLQVSSANPRYVQLIHRLESLNAITRRARGLSPWTWFRDTDTDEFRVLQLDQGTATGATSTTITDTTKLWTPSALVHGTVEIVSGAGAGQRRSISGNTGQSLTVTEAFTITPTGANYSVQWSNPAWIRVRVLNVSKRPVARGGVRYETVRVEFVIDDDNWNSAGYQVNTVPDVMLDYDPGDAGVTVTRATTATYVAGP